MAFVHVTHSTYIALLRKGLKQNLTGAQRWGQGGGGEAQIVAH